MKSRINSLKDSFIKNKILVENFTFLSALQVSNLILFIITIPYLFRVLGSENYGLIVFAQTIAFYFSVFINFGFNLTATRDVSVNRDNRDKLVEIFSTVLTVKFLLFIVSMALMVILTFSVPALRKHQWLFLFSMLAGLSEALFPIWYFQGIEKMKYITFINVFTRALATAFVFILISDPEDYLYYPLIVGFGTIAGSLIALYIVANRHRIIFILQPVTMLVCYLKENFLYFTSNVSTQLYLNANRLVIGSFLGMVELAYYDLAEKVVNIAKVPLSVLGQTLFPRVAHSRDLRFIRGILVVTVIFIGIIVFFIFAFSNQIIVLLSGNENAESILVLRVLSLSLIPISVSLFYGDLLLINFGLKVQYATMRLNGFLFYILLAGLLLLLKIFDLQYFAIVILFVESFMTLYGWVLVRTNKPNVLFNVSRRR